MKTYQCKKSLLAVGLVAALASTSALGENNYAGPLTGSSFGDFDVTATVLAEVWVYNLADVDFGNIDPTNTDPVTQDMSSNVCFYSSAPGGATVTAAYANQGSTSDVGMMVGDNVDPLDSHLEYKIHLLDSTNADLGNIFELPSGMDSPSFDFGLQTTPCVLGEGSGKIQVELMPHIGTLADTYRDTVTVTIAPIV